jgi:hypothetical protein
MTDYSEYSESSDSEMIVAKTSDRTTKNRAELISLSLGSLMQECFIVSGNASHKPYRQIASPVGCNVVAEELPEVINNQTPQCLVVEMLINI